MKREKLINFKNNKYKLYLNPLTLQIRVFQLMHKIAFYIHNNVH